jgi:hypothetical protein
VRLTVWLAGGTMSQVSTATPNAPSLVRLGRTERFRRTVRFIAQTLDLDADACSAQLVAGLPMLAQAMDKDLAEADWWRLLDALLLITTYPAVSQDATR